MSDRGGPFRDIHRSFLRAIGSPNYFNHDCTCARNVQHAALSLFGSGRKTFNYDYGNCKHLVLYGRNVFESLRVKAAGAIMDNGARDYNEIVKLHFPTFCVGLSPYDSQGRMDGKERDIPIICGGVRVKPGDLVYGDVDGVVVVPQGIVDEVVAKAWEKVQGENTVREELRAGASVVKTFEKYGIL